MKEQRSETPEPLSSLAEALLRAVDKNPGISPELTYTILERAEQLPVITTNTVGGSNVLVDVGSVNETAQLRQDSEESSMYAEEDDIDPQMFHGSHRKKPAAKPAEQEISQRQAKSPNKFGRIQTKMTLRQISASIGQRSKEITEEYPIEQSAEPEISEAIISAGYTMVGAEQRPQAITSTELTPGEQKEERRQEAQRQRAENLAQKAADKERAREVRILPDEVKEAYTRIGRDFFSFSFTPTDSVAKNIKQAEMIQHRQDIVDNFQAYSPAQQIELVRLLSLGMDISERRTNPIYRKRLGTYNNRGQKLGNPEYLLHMMTSMMGYDGELRVLFANAIMERLPKGRADLSSTQKAISEWLGDYSTKRNSVLPVPTSQAGQ